jgi:predicted metal-dependent hydrolase
MSFFRNRTNKKSGPSLWDNLFQSPQPQPESFEAEFQGIGKIQFLRNRRSNRMKIRVKPNQPVQVLVPDGQSFDKAKTWVFTKLPWIRQAVEKVNKREQKQTVFLPETSFSTHAHTLRIFSSDRKTIHILVEKGFIDIYIPIEINIESQQVQAIIRKGIEKVLHHEALAFLPGRVHELAQKHSFRITDLHFRNNKSRWGSCSAKNSINLNIHLMRLPDELIDYVIIHELVHTVHKNHSVHFWDTLEKFLPGARVFDKQLNQYRTQIY